MATTNGDAQQAFAPVLQAVNAMRDGHREEKKAAHEYLEKFQKSVRKRNRLLLFAPSFMRTYTNFRYQRGRSQSVSYNPMQIRKQRSLQLQPLRAR